MKKIFSYKNIIIAQAVLIAIIGIIAWSPFAHNPMMIGSATLDFPNTAAGTSSDLTITVTGASDGDVAVLCVPNGSTVGNGVFTAWISASNTATVRFLNNSLLAGLNPASGVFRVIVVKK